MKFKTLGNKQNPAILFFHAMGVVGESNEPVARYLQNKYFCIMPTSTVYCEEQKYISRADEIRQVEKFLHEQGIEELELVVAFSIGADLAVAFLSQTKLPVAHVFLDGGQFAQIKKGTRRIMTPFLLETMQKCTYFEFGSVEDHFKYRDAVMKAYPYGNYPVFEGYNHMQYQIKDPKGFAAMLESVMDENKIPDLPFVRPSNCTER